MKKCSIKSVHKRMRRNILIALFLHFRDFEEKEKLYVQSDLWKSKFLASSVIVDELARSKGILMQRNEDCDHYIRLFEMIRLWFIYVNNGP